MSFRAHREKSFFRSRVQCVPTETRSELSIGSAVKMKVRVKRVWSKNDLAKAFAIRIRVFVREQKVPAEIEIDSDDDQALHFLAYVGENAVGTARVVIHNGSAKIGRMAVLKTYRRNGIGTKLLKRTILSARKCNAKKI